MEYVPDSDTENSFPLLSVSDVDTGQLRDVVAFFSKETRSRLLQEAQGTPFAFLYEENPIDSDGNEPENTLEALDDEEILGQPDNLDPETNPVANPVHIPSSQHQLSEPHSSQVPEVGLPARGSRSLRKRTFASRHPYIADQADWLGICTHESINEMFDGNEDISRVVRALNRLYLQKKKRYPDDDRYRSKDFYTHLGHSKLLAVRGDSELNEDDSILRPELEGNVVDSEERNYDPHGHSSQLENSADEDDELIPYGALQIPYTQGKNEPPETNVYDGKTGKDFQGIAYNDDVSDSSDAEPSESEEQEQYIRVGGRYRKVSTILRGVLPESAKRLGIFDRTSPMKRKKPLKRTLTRRRGLAMKKMASSGVNTDDLEMEIYAHTGADSEPYAVPSDVFQPLITDSSFSRTNRPDFRGILPSLSRSSTSYTYVPDTSEPQYVGSSSGSDSDSETQGETESFGLPRHISEQSLLSFKPVTQASILRGETLWDEPIDDSEVQELDEIDPLLAPRVNASHRIGTRKSLKGSLKGSQKRGTTHTRPVLNRHLQRRISSARVAQGRLAATGKKRPVPQNRSLRVIDKHQTRLPAFRGSSMLPDKRFSGPNNAPNSRFVASSKKPKPNVPIGPKRAPFEQPFKRNPVMSNPVIEIDSLEPYVPSLPVVYGPVIHTFQPTKQSLLGCMTATSSNSLTGLDDTRLVRGLRDGRIFFANEDIVTILFLGKTFTFTLFNTEEATKNMVIVLTSLKRLLCNPTLLLRKPEIKADTRSAIKGLLKWTLICRGHTAAAVWTQMKEILNGFSKLQMREVRVLQLTIQSQVVYLFWVLIQLEYRHDSDSILSLMHALQGFASDFFVTFFSFFTAQDLSTAYNKESPTHDLFESVMLIFTIFEKETRYWWPPMVLAIDKMALLSEESIGILDMTYLLCAVIPLRFYSWSPFFAILAKLKTARDSQGYRHFIGTCQLAHQRLEWPLEEKILTQLYAVFGARKFANFVDEASVPSSVNVVNSRADIPEHSVFEKFLGLLYIYVSERSLAKEVKRLISKLLASSQYHYLRRRKSQIMFANRLNLIVLLSQISDVDLGSQLTNLVRQISDSADPFVYGRSLDALQVLCDTSVSKDAPLPGQAFVALFKALADMASHKKISLSLFQKLVDLMGHTFRGISKDNDRGVFGLLQILRALDINVVPDSLLLGVLGTVLLSLMEVEMGESGLSEKQILVVAEFQKPLLRLLSTQMNKFPMSQTIEDQTVEEVVEMTIQIWMLSSKINHTLHWNNMMYQRFSYFGNSIARHRFSLFFCLEFMQYGPVDSFVLQEIEKMFLSALVSPELSRYAVDLYRHLSQNHLSHFHCKDTSIHQILSVFSLHTFRLRIITASLRNIVDSLNLHSNEKKSVVSSLVKRLHDVYTDHRFEQGVTDMCKRVFEILLQLAKTHISGLDEFWELSAKLGLPNKNIQSKWLHADDEGKVKLLNSEFVAALVYGKNHREAMDNWKFEKDDILFALVQIYASGLAISNAYWAHVSLLLEYVLGKLENFEITTNTSKFMSFLAFLKELSHISQVSVDSRYILHEIRALNACVAILHHVFFVFDGYKDKQDVTDTIYTFMANVETPCPRKYKLQTMFMDVSIEDFQNGAHVSYHPKHQHTTDEYQKAYQDFKSALGNLMSIASEEVHEEVRSKGLANFHFI